MADEKTQHMTYLTSLCFPSLHRNLSGDDVHSHLSVTYDSAASIKFKAKKIRSDLIPWQSNDELSAEVQVKAITTGMQLKGSTAGVYLTLAENLLKQHCDTDDIHDQ